jgi:ammonia channel protein AmtB
MQEQATVDVLWMVLCSFLVFVMQAGFLFRESGLASRTSTNNVVARNLADFCLTAVVFWILGFGIMFGSTGADWMGVTVSFLESSHLDRFASAFFLLQTMFCGVAVAIVSGAVADRMRLRAHLIVANVISALIYPVFGHWAWAGLNEGVATGSLKALGFFGFAGSTVVHGSGGWAYLGALLAVGLYADLEILGTGLTRMGQIGVRLLGVALGGVWALSITSAVLRLVNGFHQLRVTAGDAELPLNVSAPNQSNGLEMPGVPGA